MTSNSAASLRHAFMYANAQGLVSVYAVVVSGTGGVAKIYSSPLPTTTNTATTIASTTMAGSQTTTNGVAAVFQDDNTLWATTASTNTLWKLVQQPNATWANAPGFPKAGVTFNTTGGTTATATGMRGIVGVTNATTGNYVLYLTTGTLGGNWLVRYDTVLDTFTGLLQAVSPFDFRSLAVRDARGLSCCVMPARLALRMCTGNT